MIDSFDHLYDTVKRLEHWLLEGKLDHVAPGKPEVSDDDLIEFFQHRGES